MNGHVLFFEINVYKYLKNVWYDLWVIETAQFLIPILSYFYIFRIEHCFLFRSPMLPFRVLDLTDEWISFNILSEITILSSFFGGQNIPWICVGIYKILHSS